jgi:hypothetical protein
MNANQTAAKQRHGLIHKFWREQKEEGNSELPVNFDFE